MRDSTIIYRSFYEAIKELPPVNQAEVWNAVFEYALNFIEPELSGLSKSIFTLIRPQLEANIKRYKAGVEHGNKGAEHGSKGGRPLLDNPLPNPVYNPLDNRVETLSKPSNVNPNPNVNDNPNEKVDKKKLAASAPDPLTDSFLEVYNHHLEKITGSTEQFSKGGRAALKKIIQHFRGLCGKKYLDQSPEFISDQVLNSWKYIWSNFENWEHFYQKQLKLEQVHSNLINIIASIKSPKTNGHTTDQQRNKQGLAEIKRMAGEVVRNATEGSNPE